MTIFIFKIHLVPLGTETLRQWDRSVLEYTDIGQDDGLQWDIFPEIDRPMDNPFAHVHERLRAVESIHPTLSLLARFSLAPLPALPGTSSLDLSRRGKGLLRRGG